MTEGLTALLLWTQYAVSGRLLFAALSGAYAFTSVIAAFQLLVFPGVFSPTGLLGAGPQTAVWIWAFWHGGFPALVTASLLTRAVPSSLTDRTKRRLAAVGAVTLALGLCALATAGQTYLPRLSRGPVRMLSYRTARQGLLSKRSASQRSGSTYRRLVCAR
ncbi:MASE4 domain-containing protein [Caballeronia grimmiae]|uniref:MASE4 domain-containing protein n=1 Tax=Caballeronia grimmiae TaxID=1071679 RepID=UPI0038B7EC3B